MTSDNYTTNLIFCTASEDTECVHQPQCDNKWQLHQHLRYLMYYETLLYWTNSSCNYNNVKSMVMLLKVNRPYRSCKHSSVFSVNTTQTKVESSCDWNSATKDALLLNMTLPQQCWRWKLCHSVICRRTYFRFMSWSNFQTDFQTQYYLQTHIFSVFILV